MAISHSLITQGSNNSSATNYNTDSFTPVANRLYLLVIAAGKTTADTDPTVTGGGLGTWTLVQGNQQGTGNQRIMVFRAMSASPGSAAAVNISWGGVTWGNCAWKIIEFDGVDTSGTNGSGAIAESVQGDDSSGPFTVSLSSVAADNYVLGCIVQNASTTLSASAGFTMLGDQPTLTGPSVGLGVEYSTTQQNPISFTSSGSPATALIGVEIQAAPSAPDVISVSLLTEGFDNDGGTSSTTASISPGANKLILLGVVAGHTGGAAQVPSSVTGNGLTWVLITSFDIASTNLYVSLWRAMGASPSSGAVTINFSSAMHNCIWQITEWDGVDTSGTNGSGAIAASNTNADTGTDFAVGMTTPASTSALYLVLGNNSQTLGYTPGAGFTQIGSESNTNDGTPSSTLFGEYDLGNASDGVADGTKVSGSNWAACACAIKALSIIQKSGSDTLALSVSESRTLLSALARSDTMALAISDARANTALLLRTDTLALVGVDASDDAVFVSRSDTMALGVTDASSITNQKVSSDTLAAAIGDASDIVSALTRADTLQVFGREVPLANTLTNPSLDVNASGWVVGDASVLSLTQQSTEVYQGAGAGRLEHLTAFPGGSTDTSHYLSARQTLNVYYDGPWILGSWVKGQAGKHVALRITRAIDGVFQWGGGSTADKSVTFALTGDWQLVTTVIDPWVGAGNTTQIGIRVGMGFSSVIGDVMYFDEAVFTGYDVNIASFSSRSDTLALAVSEARVLESALSRSDTLALTIADVTDDAIFVSRADTLVLGASDASAVTSQRTITDTLAAVISDVSTITAGNAKSDTLALTAADTSDDTIIVTRADVLALTVGDVSDALVLASRTDTLAMAISDIAGELTSVSRSDTLALAVSDASSPFTIIATVDTLFVTLTDVSAVTQQIVGVDTLLLTLGDVSTNLLSVSRIDTLAAAVSDASVSALFLSRSDSLALAIVDTSALLVTLDRADAMALGATDSSANVIALDRSDALLLSVADASSSTAVLSRSDALLITVSDASTNLLISIRADTLALTIADTSSSFVVVTLTDTLALGITDSSSHLIAVDVADSPTLLIGESSTNSLFLTLSDALLVTVADASLMIAARQVTDAVLVGATDTSTSLSRLVRSDGLLVIVGDAVSGLLRQKVLFLEPTPYDVVLVDSGEQSALIAASESTVDVMESRHSVTVPDSSHGVTVTVKNQLGALVPDSMVTVVLLTDGIGGIQVQDNGQRGVTEVN